MESFWRELVPDDDHNLCNDGTVGWLSDDGTLDGTTRPYPSWDDVDWVYMPINTGGNHWVTGAINLPDSKFYVLDSLESDGRISSIYARIRQWTITLNGILEEQGHFERTERQPYDFQCFYNQGFDFQAPQQANHSDCGVVTCFIIMSLIYESDLGRDLEDLLEEDDLAMVLSSNHRPRCIIQFISQSMQLLDLEEQKRIVLESKLTCFHQGISVCEQIMGIPIPLSYTRLTSRFLVLWHLTLPVILWDDCNWIVVPATFVSAASLFCIEEVGVLIEEPFQMLALDELCIRVGVLIQEPFQMLVLDRHCIRVCDYIQEAMNREKKIRESLTKKKEDASRKPSRNGHLTSAREQHA
ncbi:UPF0187 protein, chloroplastic-like protein [Tanacetum coccineum]